MSLLSRFLQRQWRRSPLRHPASALCLLLAGCTPSLPRGLLQFAPDGRSALLFGGEELGSYDLSTQRARWKIPSHDVRVMSLSSNGAFFVAGQWPNGPDVKLRVYRTGTAAPVGRPVDAHASISVIDSAQSKAFAISDDGQTLVNASLMGQATIFDVSSGSLIWQGDSRGAAVGFSPRSGQLAVARDDDILVLERRGNAMAEVAKVPSRGFFAWSARGLAVLGDGGVDLWDGHSVQRALRVAVKYNSSVADNSSFIAVSPDGHYFVNEAGGLKVYDLGSGRELFTRADLKGLKGTAFRGQTLRVVWDDETSDDATFSRCSDLELPGGRTLRTQDLGKRVSWIKKSWFNPHAGPQGHFIPKLSPTGDFVDLLSISLGDGHEIVAL